MDLLPQMVIGNLTIIPAHTDFSAFSPTYLAVFLVALSFVPILIYIAGRPAAPSRQLPSWTAASSRSNPECSTPP